MMRHTSIASVAFFSAIPNTAAFHVSTVLGSRIYDKTSSTTVVHLFDDDQDMIPIAENYIHSKYQTVAASHGRSKCDKDDAREVLQAVLPPVTPAELEGEVTKICSIIMKNPKNSATAIEEDDFVKAIVQNTYWEEAGDLVVKELMYLDSLYSYYKTGTSLLANDDYEALKENLTWEGSSVPTMSGKEALFVTAVAAAQRGRPLLNDVEYGALKEELKSQNSWVTSREADALEKLKIQTFMGYLHRALK
jgi:hypothetical protein